MVFDYREDENADIDPGAPGGRFGYRIGHSDGDYKIPDRILNTVDDCNVRVLTIGAGMSGILMAHLIQRDCINVTHAIYEKNGDIGGTWLENRYPGAACDVPSHAYTYAFALNADWPQYLSESDDIFRYLTRVVDCFELRKFMRFNSIVQKCEWNEEEGLWLVEIRDALSGEVFQDTCHILIGANGLLNDWKFPEEVENLHSFEGKLFHTARWIDDYGPEEWKNDRVAVLGSGASAIQTVPTMQPHVKHMDVFIRTAIWFVDLAGHSGINSDYPAEERRALKDDTDALVELAKSIEGGLNGIHGIKAMMTGSAEAKMARERFAARMRDFIKDEELQKLLVPDFPFGCRRLTPGDPFMKAVQQGNVSVHKGAVTKIKPPNTVVCANGDEVEVDTRICATGFDVSYVPHYTMKGRNGVLLQDKWAKIPQGYMGLAVPDMPNYYMFQGPTFPVSNGSVLGPLQAVGAYIIQVIRKMQKEDIHSFEPQQSVTEMFNHHAQTWIVGTTWADRKCRAWYKDNETGRVNSVWPGSSLHYAQMIETPRWEDYNIKYSHSNMFAFMGLGFTIDQAENGDLSPYISKEAIEKKFYSFKPMPDEEERVRERRYKVNDGPKALAIKPNGPLRVNGSLVNGTQVNGDSQ